MQFEEPFDHSNEHDKNEESKEVTTKSLLDAVLEKNEDELHPWEKVVLPSRGLYYDGLIPDGVVEVKPFGLYADKILSTQRLVKSGEALNYLYKKYVKLPNDFDCLNLLDADRTFLLYYLRGITYGNEYEFILTCPECSQKSMHEYDLNELYSTVTPPNPDLGDEPFPVRLPDLSDVCGTDFYVKVRFLRGYDSMDMLGASKANIGLPGRARSRKKKDWRSRITEEDTIRDRGDTIDDTLERNINRLIVEAGGETDRRKIRMLVDKLSSADISEIMDFLRLNTPSIDTSIEADCPSCGSVITTQLPITDQFFRSKKRRRHRK